MYLKVSLLLMLLLVYQANSTLGPGDKKAKKSSKELAKPVIVPQTNTEKTFSNLNIYQRQLIKPDNISTKEIIDNHADFCKSCDHLKNFKNKILGYVTPWNSKGYDLAKIFAKKFDMVTPVWLQIVRKGRKNYEFTGTHDIDQNWMKTVKKNSQTEDGNHAEFLPRILFEKFEPEDLHALFNNEEETIALGKYLVKKANEYQFDGYTLEIFMQLQGNAKSAIHHLIYDLADELHDDNKKLLLVISPSLEIRMESKDSEKVIDMFNKDDFDLLKDKVDYFSLMTYDYPSSVKAIATNAPYYWVKRNVEYLTDEMKYRQKILMGLNFYGYRFDIDVEKNKLDTNPQAIIGDQLINMLKESENWSVSPNHDWEDSLEHQFTYKSKNKLKVIYFPTLYSILAKIKLATDLGTGIAIWELGQGLDYFFEIL